jgi:hypothetical protein
VKNALATGILTLALGLGLIATASARSCSEQGSECKGWARANLTGPQQTGGIAVCGAEVPKCIARCKSGQKYFVGIGGSNQYPIDTCR